MLGGVLAYTRVGSVPSLVACMGISGLMVVSSMRIRDGMNWGNEAAAGEWYNSWQLAFSPDILRRSSPSQCLVD